MVCICLDFLSSQCSVEKVISVLWISNSGFIKKASSSPPQSIQPYELGVAVLIINTLTQIPVNR